MFFPIIIILSINYAAELKIHIEPDSIYVGTLASVRVSVENLNAGEIPFFYPIADESSMFTVVDHVLTDHSNDYILQFWEGEIISIPSIKVVIRKNKQDILSLQTGPIKIPVLSNINDNNKILKSMKSMYALKITSPYRTLVYLIILLLGLCLSSYLWKNREKILNKKTLNKNNSISIYKKTISSLNSIKLPENINSQTTEEYYIELSSLCRTYIKEEYFIRATEMTSDELEIYFKSIKINQDLIKSWVLANKIADMVKYAGQVPTISQFNKDKKAFINIVKSFHRINPQVSNDYSLKSFSKG